MPEACLEATLAIHSSSLSVLLAQRMAPYRRKSAQACARDQRYAPRRQGPEHYGVNVPELRLHVLYVRTYLCAYIHMNDYNRRNASDLSEPLSGTQSNHLVRTSDNLDRSTTLMHSLPLELFKNRRMVVAPVHEGMSYSSLSQSGEE